MKTPEPSCYKVMMLNERQNRHEEALDSWYMSKKDIMENSPSKKDGISWKTEMYLRRSYCTFLKKLGRVLKVPQVYIASAILLCHRFFLRQSLAKNDRWTIATVCLFIAGKIEDNPRPISEIVLVSYEIIHDKDPFAVRRIKQKEVYDEQKKLILLGERLVLITLDFAIDVRLPYKHLVEALKKFELMGHMLGKVAWNLVNDGMDTLLCLQFRPQKIAAGAIFLAANLLEVTVPWTDWCLNFDVTQLELDEISNQMMGLYERKKVPTYGGTEADKTAVNAEQESPKIWSCSPENIDWIAEVDSYIIDPYMGHEIGDGQNSEQLPQEDNKQEVTDRSNASTERVRPADQDRIGRTIEAAEIKTSDDSVANKSSCDVDLSLELQESLNRYSPNEVIKMIGENKLKAALERMNKETMLEKDKMDEDDVIEKELEDGIELAVEDVKHDSLDNDDDDDKNHDETRDVKHGGPNAGSAEEQNVTDDAMPVPNNRKRTAGSPPAEQPAAKRRLVVGDHNDCSE